MVYNLPYTQILQTTETFIGQNLLKTHICLMPDWCCQKLGPNKHLFEISSYMKCKIHENAPKRCGREFENCVTATEYRLDSKTLA